MALRQKKCSRKSTEQEWAVQQLKYAKKHQNLGHLMLTHSGSLLWQYFHPCTTTWT
jgi:hypothetical protein